MEKSTSGILEKLLETPSISGSEGAISAIIKKELSGFKGIEFSNDSLGNLTASFKGTLPAREKHSILISAHMDQWGLIITHVEENGLLRFSNIGGVSIKALFGKRVRVFGKKELWGVIGVKPPHLMSAEEADKIPPIKDLFIDCGFNGREMEGLVKAGDLALPDQTATKLGSNCYSGLGLDDKAGVLALIMTAKLLSDRHPRHDMHLMFTVQEEVGTRGARTGTFRIKPDIGIACDATFAEAGHSSKITLGKGPALSTGPGHHRLLAKKLKQIADREDIPIQSEIEVRPHGTDASVMQISRAGVYTGLVAIPCRYMHSQTEVVNLRDIYRSARLMANLGWEEELHMTEVKS